MRSIIIATLLFVILALMPGCTQKKEEINVSCAASLKDVIEEISTTFGEEYPDVNLMVNYASSGTIVNQIKEGAPIDVFVSAGRKEIDSLNKEDLIDSGSIAEIAGNELVLVVGKGKEKVRFDELPKDIEYIAIGEPETVPAGRYAKEAFINLGNWDKVQPQLVLAKDVRSVLAYVESGSAGAGAVYKTDAMISDKVEITDTAPESSHEKISYYAVIVKDSGNRNGAREFMDFLKSEKAKAIFKKFGFEV